MTLSFYAKSSESWFLEGYSFVSRKIFTDAKLDEKKGIYFLDSKRHKSIPIYCTVFDIEQFAEENNAVVDYQLFFEKALLNRDILQIIRNNQKGLEEYFEHI